MKPEHLSPEQQAQALTEWGRPGSFRCCACGAESTGHANPVPTRYDIQLGACIPCARKMRLSPTYRRQARQRIDEAAFRTLWQRTADLVGVTGRAMADAVNGINAAHMPLTSAHLETRLGVPPGSVDSALARVLGAGQLQ
ncbi:MAG: hypothetical protein AB9M60_00705 [Leptothrix sp. (in: b-proteobacteria)]